MATAALKYGDDHAMQKLVKPRHRKTDAKSDDFAPILVYASTGFNPLDWHPSKNLG